MSPLESTWTAPREDCPYPERYSAPDAEATETEVAIFLAGLCVALQPERVLETGSYKGFTTAAMGSTLVNGHLDALEIRPDRAQAARERCEGLPVTIHEVDSLEFTTDEKYDLIFFDSDVESRKQELRQFRRFASNRCIWAIHDSRDHKIQQLLEDLRRSGNIAGFVNLPTPRGISIGRYQ